MHMRMHMHSSQRDHTIYKMKLSLETARSPVSFAAAGDNTQVI